MSRELNGVEQRLLTDLLKNLPTVRNFGLDMEGAFLFKPDNWPQPKDAEPSKWPRKLKLGEEGVIWAKMGEPFEKMGYVDVRLFAMDAALGRPFYSYRYLPNDGDIVDKYPSTFRLYTYGLQEVNFSKKDIKPIPFNVVRQTVEVFDCVPRSARIGARTHLMVNRQIYVRNELNDLFAPFRVVSASRFELAPEGFVNPFGETEQQMWVEATRKFRFRDIEVTYSRSGKGEMLIGEQGGALSDSAGFTDSVGEAELILLNQTPEKGR